MREGRACSVASSPMYCAWYSRQSAAMAASCACARVHTHMHTGSLVCCSDMRQVFCWAGHVPKHVPPDMHH